MTNLEVLEFFMNAIISGMILGVFAYVLVFSWQGRRRR